MYRQLELDEIILKTDRFKLISGYCYSNHPYGNLVMLSAGSTPANYPKSIFYRKLPDKTPNGNLLIF